MLLLECREHDRGEGDRGEDPGRKKCHCINYIIQTFPLKNTVCYRDCDWSISGRSPAGDHWYTYLYVEMEEASREDGTDLVVAVGES